MVNEKLIIPQENIYKTEEVRYLENQELKTTKPTEKDFFIGCPAESDGGGENGDGVDSGGDNADEMEAKIEYYDAEKEAIQHNEDEFREMEREDADEVCNIL